MVQQRVPVAAFFLLLGVFFGLITGPAAEAGEVEVVAVDVQHQQGGRYRFAVTLRHQDEGWAHYADAWEVRGPDGEVFGRRVLAHPHVDEQPFTRSLSGVKVPAGIAEVTVVAHDKVHGESAAFKVPLPPAG
ncbi:MAG: hypothetical protein AAF184_12440 [Pseudomonadota bacterium]